LLLVWVLGFCLFKGGGKRKSFLFVCVRFFGSCSLVSVFFPSSLLQMRPARLLLAAQGGHGCCRRGGSRGKVSRVGVGRARGSESGESALLDERRRRRRRRRSSESVVVVVVVVVFELRATSPRHPGGRPRRPAGRHDGLFLFFERRRRATPRDVAERSDELLLFFFFLVVVLVVVVKAWLMLSPLARSFLLFFSAVALS